MSQHYLDRLFEPRSIALFGASVRPESVGGRVFENLLRGGFEGPIYPINARHDKVQGKQAYASIADIGKPVDLAVFATPARTVPELLHQAGEHGVRAAIVLSAGFGEGEGGGSEHQQALMQEARRYGIHLVGPNCLGMITPRLGINATFSKNDAKPGSLALVSQSGAICTAILDWAAARPIGFSSIVSLGSMADVDFGQVLDYLALDPNTQSILLYVEGIRTARKFVSGLRVAARFKPTIVVKAGRHEAGSRAAMSHTGSLVGADDVFEAALRRTGAVRAMSIEQLFAAAQFLSMHHQVGGDNLAVVTNAGGPGVLAADRAVDVGVNVPELSPESVEKLNAVLPASWSHSNPIDILGDATSERYEAALDACLADPTMNGTLVMLTPQAMTEPTEIAQAVAERAAKAKKPVLTCWMGEQLVGAGRNLLEAKRIPTFTSPEGAVEAFGYLAQYRRNQQMLLQVPGPLSRGMTDLDLEGARLVIEGAMSEGRRTLSTSESKAVFSAFGIPVMPSIDARSANEALVAARTLGFPVAMKINSHNITHKSDVNGVRLGIGSAHDVRTTFNEMVADVKAVQPDAIVEGITVEKMYRHPHGREVLVGVLRDPVFGPVVTFGAGGTAVEVMRDRAVDLPPLNTFIAREMIQRTRISKLLGEFRNLPPADIDALVSILLRVSGMVCELPHILELDINPLIVDETGAVALDARIGVDYPEPNVGRYDHVAIHPYPSLHESKLQLGDGTDITIRPIRPEDAEMEQEFIRALSPEAKYFRFMRSLNELTPEMLIRFTQIDYDREMAFIATTVDPETHKEIEIAVGRYVVNPDGRTCEFALVVSDKHRRQSIGNRIMMALMESAKRRGLRAIEGEVLSNNEPMLHLMRRLGFSIRTSDEDRGIQLVVKDL